VVVQEEDALDPVLLRLPDGAKFPNFMRIVEPKKRRPQPKRPSGARARPSHTLTYADRVVGPRGHQGSKVPRSGRSSSSERGPLGSGAPGRVCPNSLCQNEVVVVRGLRRPSPPKLEEVDEKHIEQVVHQNEVVVKIVASRGPPPRNSRR
jgi:hypothetical protein